MREGEREGERKRKGESEKGGQTMGRTNNNNLSFFVAHTSSLSIYDDLFLLQRPITINHHRPS